LGRQEYPQPFFSDYENSADGSLFHIINGEKSF